MSTGWALLKGSDGRDPLADDVCFEFALTTNAGENWSVVRPKIVDPVSQSAITEDGQGFSATTFLDFADAQHGWAILKRNLQVGRSSGVMLRTADGGKTWTQPSKNTLPFAERFYFLDSQRGWMVGGPEKEIYATKDSGASWVRSQMPAPDRISRDLTPVYDLPTFADAKIGYLQANYESSTSTNVPLAVFRIEDSGETWHHLITVDHLPDTHPWAAYPAAITGGELLVAMVSGGKIDFSHTGVDASSHKSALIPVRPSSVDMMSFLTSPRGWILATYWILSTDDGGASWVNVTPDRTQTVPPGSASNDERVYGSSEAVSPATSAGATLALGNFSTHLGFDTWPTRPLGHNGGWPIPSIVER